VGEKGKMAITKKEVEKIARLSRLGMSEEEKDMFTKQLDTILEYVNKLKEVDVSSVDESRNVWKTMPHRDDAVKPSLSVDDALSNAPDKSKGHFKVPRIIE